MTIDKFLYQNNTCNKYEGLWVSEKDARTTTKKLIKGELILVESAYFITDEKDSSRTIDGKTCQVKIGPE